MNKKQNFDNFLNELQLRLELDRHAHEQLNNVIIDNVVGIIGRYVYLRNLNNELVTMSDLSFILNCTETTIRSKVMYMMENDLIDRRQNPNDKRILNLYPTSLLKKTMTVNASRTLKTLFEIAPLYEVILGDDARNFMNKNSTDMHPGYSPDLTVNTGYHQKFKDFFSKFYGYAECKKDKNPQSLTVTVEGNKHGQ